VLTLPACCLVCVFVVYVPLLDTATAAIGMWSRACCEPTAGAGAAAAQGVWPVENRVVEPDFVRAGSRHAMAEMIRTGTTCFNDMFFFPDITAQVCTAFFVGLYVWAYVLPCHACVARVCARIVAWHVRMFV
jgi:hypothetical protein